MLHGYCILCRQQRTLRYSASYYISIQNKQTNNNAAEVFNEQIM